MIVASLLFLGGVVVGWGLGRLNLQSAKPWPPVGSHARQLAIDDWHKRHGGYQGGPKDK